MQTAAVYHQSGTVSGPMESNEAKLVEAKNRLPLHTCAAPHLPVWAENGIVTYDESVIVFSREFDILVIFQEISLKLCPIVCYVVFME